MKSRLNRLNRLIDKAESEERDIKPYMRLCMAYNPDLTEEQFIANQKAKRLEWSRMTARERAARKEQAYADLKALYQTGVN